MENRLFNTGKGTVRCIYKGHVALPQGLQIHLPGGIYGVL